MSIDTEVLICDINTPSWAFNHLDLTPVAVGFNPTYGNLRQLCTLGDIRGLNVLTKITSMDKSRKWVFLTLNITLWQISHFLVEFQ